MSAAKNLLRQLAEMGHWLVTAYVQDLCDADLLIRSVPGANHIAWQLGHIIGSTAQMLGELGREAPVLPDGFAEEYTAETSALDAPGRFATKAEYLTLLDQMKTAILAAIDATPEEDLDKPGPESMREYAPTIGAGLAVLGNHWIMHSGQFVPIRRKLGKKPLF